MEKNSIKVIINSSYAVVQTSHLAAQSRGDDHTVLELEQGTTVEEMLLKIPSIGSPDRWDDIMLHVFVNREIAGFNQVLKDNDIIDLLVPISGG